MKLKSPILLVGLPGIGLVGQVVCKYLISKFKAKKMAEVYSPHFPHHVIMTKKGAIRPIKNQLYCATLGKRDVILMVGDVQAITSEGQYEVAGSIVDYAAKHGVKRVISIGGYSTGKISEHRRVFAVVGQKVLVEEFKKAGIIFGETKGAIVGAAGLIPALAKLKGMEGACIMGETHGSYVDAVSARNVISALEKLIGFTVDISELDKQAKEGEKIIKKIEEEVQKQVITPYNPEERNVSYIR